MHIIFYNVRFVNRLNGLFQYFPKKFFKARKSGIKAEKKSKKILSQPRGEQEERGKSAEFKARKKGPSGGKLPLDLIGFHIFVADDV